MKRLLQGLVAALCLWLVFSRVDLGALGNVLGALRMFSMGLAVALFFLAWCLATYKWQLLWHRATWWEMLKANFASQFYSLILPGQIAGEVVKAYRLGQRFSGTSSIAASVLVDRATSLLGLLLLAFGGVLLSATSTPANAILLLSLSAAAICGLLYAITLPWIFDSAEAALRKVGEKLPKLQGLSGKLLEFLSAWAALMSSPWRIFAAICLGLVFQAISVAINYLVAADLGIAIGFADWCWIIGLVSIALLLPITIAGIGVREGVYIGLLGTLGVSIEKALAVSIVIFGIAILGGLVGGVVELVHAIRAKPDSAR